jgi:hypothetical protein
VDCLIAIHQCCQMRCHQSQRERPQTSCFLESMTVFTFICGLLSLLHRPQATRAVSPPRGPCAHDSALSPGLSVPSRCRAKVSTNPTLDWLSQRIETSDSSLMVSSTDENNFSREFDHRNGKCQKRFKSSLSNRSRGISSLDHLSLLSILEREAERERAREERQSLSTGLMDQSLRGQ